MFDFNSHPQQYPTWHTPTSANSSVSYASSSALHRNMSPASSPSVSSYSTSTSPSTAASYATSSRSTSSFANTVHATNIDPRQSEKDIKFFFAHCGTIASLTIIPPNPGRGSRTQTATVIFDHRDAAQTALMLDRCRFGDYEVAVRSAAAVARASGGGEAEYAPSGYPAAFKGGYAAAGYGGVGATGSGVGYGGEFTPSYGNVYGIGNGKTYVHGRGLADVYSDVK